MRHRVAHLSGAALLVLVPALGCRSKPLQELDGGIGSLDAQIHPIGDAGGDGGVGDEWHATDAGGAITIPIRKHTAMKVYIENPLPTRQDTNPRSNTGDGTPEMPFSPPVKWASGEFSRKKNISAIATVIMAK